MSRINYNSIDLDNMDDELFDDLYKDDNKEMPKFKEVTFKKLKKTPIRKKNTKEE